jgi:hypothetical protein
MIYKTDFGSSLDVVPLRTRTSVGELLDKHLLTISLSTGSLYHSNLYEFPYAGNASNKLFTSKKTQSKKSNPKKSPYAQPSTSDIDDYRVEHDLPTRQHDQPVCLDDRLTCPQGGQLLLIAGPVFAFPSSLMVTGPVRPLNGISKYDIGCPA